MNQVSTIPQIEAAQIVDEIGHGKSEIDIATNENEEIILNERGNMLLALTPADISSQILLTREVEQHKKRKAKATKGKRI